MKKELHLEKLPYKKDALSPVMSEETIKYHRDNLAASYVKRFNEGKGDLSFNEAGAFLHNIFFPQLQPPSGQNKPYGACLDLINENYDSFDSFKEEFLKEAMSIQGSGWAYLARNGKIKKIKNHQIKNDIILLIDWWEHAWALDYQSKKDKYLENMWKIINWDVINDRLNIKKARMSKILEITKNL
jgi:Fe-Mn family superoxide dismutase